MNSLSKSFFISLLPVMATVVLAINLYKMFTLGFSFTALGLSISAAGIVSFFIFLYIFYPARTSRNLLNFGIFILAGTMLVLYANISISADINALITSLALVTAWFFYINWFSSFGDRTNVILNVGNHFPEVTLENNKKEAIHTDVFLGKPTVYLFYRGNWCALCMGQINEVVTEYKRLIRSNVNMVFISPQPHKYSEKLAKKHGLTFHFLTDKDNTAAKALNIEHKNGIPASFQVFGYNSNTVYPTVVVTNKRGEIIFSDLTDNYRVRPEPETFLELADKAR